MYIKDLISLMKVLGSNMSKILQCCLKKEKTEIEIDIMNGIVGSVKHHEKISHFIVSGIFVILVSFYEIQQLLSIDGPLHNYCFVFQVQISMSESGNSYNYLFFLLSDEQSRCCLESFHQNVFPDCHIIIG